MGASVASLSRLTIDNAFLSTRSIAKKVGSGTQMLYVVLLRTFTTLRQAEREALLEDYLGAFEPGAAEKVRFREENDIKVCGP